MQHKPLPSQARLKQLFDYNHETGELIWKEKPKKGSVKPGAVAGSLRAGYIRIRIDQSDYVAHRLVWMFVYGTDPGDMTIDHIDRNRSNNRIENLRLATQAQQVCNTNASGCYKHSKSGRWTATIQVDKKPKHLGCFITKQLAMLAHDIASRNAFGEFQLPKVGNPFGFKNQFLSPWPNYYKGVSFCKKTMRWIARSYRDKKTTWLGYFATKEDARLAVLAFEK